MSGVCHRKSRGGFFAAGVVLLRALGALSDGAFKVYARACLHAERPSGRLTFECAELARSLGKAVAHWGGTCANWSAPGSASWRAPPTSIALGAGRAPRLLALSRRRGPYRPAGRQRCRLCHGGPPGVPRTDLRACRLRPRRRPAGGGLARGPGGPLESARRAPLLGSARNSLVLLERPTRSLRYFEPLLREVEQERIPDTYWRHLEFNVRR